MRSTGIAARLLAATAICLISSSPAFAQDNGLESTDGTPVTNPAGTTIEGNKKGVYSTGEELNLDNAGTIRGNGTNGSINSPDGGVVIIGGPANITNSGSISGFHFGITTGDFDPSLTEVDGRAIGSTVTNSGSIIGDNNDGVRLIGGGDVINSGYIAGRNSSGSDGVSMFRFDDQDPSGMTGIGTVTNLAGGTIEGQRFGVILSGGGTVDNAGTITGVSGGILIQALLSDTGKFGEVINSGTINGAVRFTALTGATLDNSGSITTSVSGSAVNSDSPLTMANSATGTITGAASGIVASGSSFSLTNEGTIRGNGNSTDFNAPNGGVIVTGGPAEITNGGTISGQRFGLTTFYFVDPLTFAQSGRAIGSTVDNSGSIIGDNDDGVRLIGGGTVTNSGYIAGRVGSLADGVSMFSFDDQPLDSFVQIGTVTNLAGGVIEGNRFGVILSNGGTVDNAGTISGNSGSITIQAQTYDPGRTGTVINSGTLNGQVGFFGLADGSLTNSGTIIGATNGVHQDSDSFTIENGGTIRGNGTSTNFDIPNAGILVTGGPTDITNSGSISGARFGITTALHFNTADGSSDWRTTQTTVTNSGSIIGDSDDGIRLIGGGTVTNSGYVAGRVGGGADGVSMFSFAGQDLTSFTQIGSLTNLAGGVIEGNRYGVILSNGGTVDNVGTISGGVGSIHIQAQLNDPGRTGTVNNSGILNGRVSFFGLASATVTNSGSITNTQEATDAFGLGAAVHGSAVTLTNTETGTITGAASGIFNWGESLAVLNHGTIRGNGSYDGFDRPPDAGITFSGGPADIENTGTISGQRFGITSAYTCVPGSNPCVLEGRAIGSTVDNSGTIIGDTDIGIRLIGGGDVINSGYIAGRVGPSADGVWMMAFSGQPLDSFVQIGTVTNLAGGVIEGNRRGVTLANGGTVNNAGTISGNVAGVRIVALANDPGRTGAVNNDGTINGVVELIGLASASVDNNGTITGATRGVFSDSPFTLDNSGTIRGNGTMGGSATPDGGIVVSRGPVEISNSGTISGQRYGITTALWTNPVTNQLEIRIGDVDIVNSGSIIGDTDDGIRIGGGGGTVTNSGTISGRVGATADGIGMFFYGGQDTTDFTGVGTVDNLAGGVIEGNRYGVVLDGGGTINNAGTISNTFILGLHAADGRIGTVNNSGTINGLSNMGWMSNANLTNSGQIGGNVGFTQIGTASMVNSGSVGAQTYFVGVGDASLTNSGALNNYVYFESVADATVSNSGSITAPIGWGIHAAYGMGDLSIVNDATGSITGSKSGIFSQASTLSLINDGTIRGNGTFDGFGDTPDGGVTISGGPATVQNYGSITGQRFGITTIYNWDAQTEQLEGLAIGSSIENDGTIIGDTDDGIRLIGGGTVTNSGYIAGRVGQFADGVSMFAFDDQPLDSFAQIGTVTNLAGSVIEGNRFGVILSGGGTVNNAGTIGGNTGGIQVQAQANDPGRTGNVINSGVINGHVGFFGLASATLNNSGSISSATGAAIRSDAATTLTNSGTINGTGATAVQLGSLNDSVTLQTGSAINGAVDGGTGTDSLSLSGSSDTPTVSQTFGQFVGFETLAVLSGYWQGVGNNGSFNSTTVSGGTLAINGSISSPITVMAAARLGGTGTITGNVTVNGSAYLAPGNSIGTLNVTGNFNFGSGSIFQVETAPSGLADRLAVNGNVTIGNGASVQVLAGSVGTNYAANTIYTILTANSISGKFGSVTTDLAFLKPILAHKSKEILLTLSRNGRPLTSASTASTFGTASAVAGFDESNPIYRAVLVQSFDGAQQAFASLSGGALAQLDSLVADDVGRLRLGLEAASSRGAALEWSGSRSLHAAGYHAGSAMSYGPISVMLLGGQRVGGLSTDEVSGEVRTRFVAGAVGYRSNRLQAMAGMTTGWHDISVNRTIAFPGFAEHAGSRYSAESRHLQGEISYSLSRGKIGLAPYAALSRLTIETPAFRETGGAAALSFAESGQSTDRLALGVRMAGTTEVGEVLLSPRLDVSLGRSWGDIGGRRRARFLSGSDSFESIGDGFDDRYIALEAGIDLKLGPMTISGSYRGQLGQDSRAHSASWTASLPF